MAPYVLFVISSQEINGALYDAIEEAEVESGEFRGLTEEKIPDNEDSGDLR